MKEMSIKIGLCLLSSILFGLAFPPIGWWFCIVPAMIPLFIAIKGVSQRKAFYLGFLQGFAGFAFSLSWFFLIFKGGAIVLYLILAFWTAISCLLINRVELRLKNKWLVLLTVSAIWTAFEFIRSEVYFLRFPWATPGLALGPTWLNSLIGVYGTTFLLIAGSYAVTKKDLRLSGGVFLGILLMLGLVRPGTVEIDQDHAIRVAAVQSERCNLGRYMKLSAPLLKKKPAIILWPEYALAYDIAVFPEDIETIRQLAEQSESVIVFGTKNSFSKDPYLWHNQAITVNKTGILGRHNKNRPVHFFDDGTAADTAIPVKTPQGTFGTPICFDCDYEDVMRNMTAAGAEYFIIPSYDAKHWGRGQHWQHADIFKMRAAENGRWLLICATSGVSQLIDPHGNRHDYLEPMVEDVLIGELEPRKSNTVYVMFGWMFPWLCVYGVAGWMVYLRIRKKINPKPAEDPHLTSPGTGEESEGKDNE